MLYKNFTKLSAAVHELSCPQAFLPYLAMVKNLIIRSCHLDLQPMTLQFNRVRAVIKIHVRAKFHQAACSGSRVIVVTEKKISDENNTVRRYRADSDNRREITRGSSLSTTTLQTLGCREWTRGSEAAYRPPHALTTLGTTHG